MAYEVLFDVTNERPALWFPAFGLLFVAVGALLWRYRDRTPWVWSGVFLTSPGLRKAFAGFFLGFSALWTAGSGILIVGSHLAAQGALRQGTARVVEGEVENFQPMPRNGKGTEQFTVGGVRFAYSDYIVSPGFSQTTLKGGPIREGLHVRIHYSGERDSATILKLEIKK